MHNETEKYQFKEPIKTIAIIGAGMDQSFLADTGATGIVLAKAALAEGFASISIFEQRSDLGGAWHSPLHTGL